MVPDQKPFHIRIRIGSGFEIQIRTRKAKLVPEKKGINVRLKNVKGGGGGAWFSLEGWRLLYSQKILPEGLNRSFCQNNSTKFLPNFFYSRLNPDRYTDFRYSEHRQLRNKNYGPVLSKRTIPPTAPCIWIEVDTILYGAGGGGGGGGGAQSKNFKTETRIAKLNGR